MVTKTIDSDVKIKTIDTIVSAIDSLTALVCCTLLRQMRFKYCGIFSIFLTVFNLCWTFYLLQKSNFPSKASKTLPARVKLLSPVKRTGYNKSINNLSFESSSDYIFKLAFSDIDFPVARWDSQRLYKLYDFALVGDTFVKSSVNNLVCLSTQTSVERLYSLVQVARQWSGPISIAVYLAGREEFAILQYYVTYMRLCFPFIRNNVTFHLAVPHDNEPDHEYLYSGAERFDCQLPEQTLRKLLKWRSPDSIQWRLKKEYPQNHMRNLARKGCQNKYVFLTDIDIIPSGEIVPRLNIFLRSEQCQHCAYVIPTFEIDVRAKFPSSKVDLLRLYKKGLARPFHEKVFIYNQYATNFSSWVNDSSKEDNMIHISHTVTNFEFLYEPFYIAFDDAPVHDEKFIGYGFTRNSQVYEMHVAGYTFHVLSPVFTCHWGLQQKKVRPAWREHQNSRNRERFEKFKYEIFARYKKSFQVKV